MANSLLNNLIGYWGLDEAAGANNALDKHSSSRTLTQHNSPGSDTGKVYSGARTLNGTSQYFDRASETSLQMGDNDFTIAAWIYLSTVTANQSIVAKLNAGVSGEYALYFNYDDHTPNSRLSFAVIAPGGAATTVDATTFGALSTNTWYLVIAWHDAQNNQVGISVNAGTADTVAHSGGGDATAVAFASGALLAGGTPAYYTSGRLGPVAIWKSSAGSGGVLTSTQRTQLYNSGNGLAYASFDNGTSSTVDLTATGIITGTPTLGTPTIGQIHALTAAAITAGTPVLGTPSMSGTAALTAAAITTGAPTLGTPALGQTHALTASGITTGTPTLGTPSAQPLLAACIGGVLRANATNGRYLENDSGPLVLAGFHTWYNFQDGGTGNPPAAFDWNTYKAALISKGVNFTKLWSLETAKDWPSLPDHYFAPLPWQRTGPGNAADGGLKFDLTKFNDTYFDRLRTRVVELGNEGIYAAIMLFDGFHIDATKPGGGSGNPWAYHPFNSANNINSINGDIDGDGIGDDARSTTNTAAYNAQKALVEKVIDTVNDLDNVLYEISNEDGTYAETWQKALIDYIHTYENGKAKQHPVGMTKIYPDGTNTMLTSSNANWISPDEDLTPAVQNSTAKSWMYDTDHAVGITTDRKWMWIALCQGYGGAWYMDMWDFDASGAGGYGDTRNNATYEIIRYNLGWLLDYAAQIDLGHATPQGALSSTGYALAKTTGLVQILAYQSDNGAFTVDLSALPGTFSLNWQRVANSAGTIQAGSNVSGGATRTLTPPWAGEDVVAFLELIGYDLTATGITTGAPALGTPTVGQTHALTAAGIATGAPTVAAPTLAQTHALAAAGITTGTPTLDAPTIGQVHALTAVAITTAAPTLGTPSMSGESALAASDITAGTPILDTPTLAQIHVLAAVTVVTGAPVLDAPAIGQTHALSAAGIATGTPTLGTPSMVGESALVAADIATGAAVLGTPAIGQVHALAAGSVTAGAPSMGAPAINQIHILTAVLIVAGTPALGAPSLDMAVIPTPAERTYVVAWEDRTYVVSAEDRTYTIGE